MRQTYRVLAILSRLGVVVQAAASHSAWFLTLIKDLDDGASLDKDYDGNVGHALHGIFGLMGIPLLASSLFMSRSSPSSTAGEVGRLRAARGDAAGRSRVHAFGVPAIGALHGINAFVVLGSPDHRWRAAEAPTTEPASPSPVSEPPDGTDDPDDARPDGRRRTEPHRTQPRRTMLHRRRLHPLPRRAARRKRRRRSIGAGRRGRRDRGSATLGCFWKQSLLPDTYSVMAMGYHDYGGGPVPESMHGHGRHGRQMSRGHGPRRDGRRPVSVADLTGPSGPARRALTLTAREETVELAGEGDRVGLDGITLNHQSPGPTITIRAGDLLEVTLVNESVTDGITLHWHGVDVPNGEDGVAGVTQDAVEEGDEYVYRFVVDDPGTYWYHSHQVSDEQVSKGLFGPLVVLPRADAPAPTASCPSTTSSRHGAHLRREPHGQRRRSAPTGSRPSPATQCACASSTPTTARCVPG